jgi:hypothetical protein
MNAKTFDLEFENIPFSLAESDKVIPNVLVHRISHQPARQVLVTGAATYAFALGKETILTGLRPQWEVRAIDNPTSKRVYEFLCDFAAAINADPHAKRCVFTGVSPRDLSAFLQRLVEPIDLAVFVVGLYRSHPDVIVEIRDVLRQRWGGSECTARLEVITSAEDNRVLIDTSLTLKRMFAQGDDPRELFLKALQMRDG